MNPVPPVTAMRMVSSAYQGQMRVVKRVMTERTSVKDRYGVDPSDIKAQGFAALTAHRAANNRYVGLKERL